MPGKTPHGFTNPNDQMHPQDRRNLIVFIVVAAVIYFAFDHFIMQPKIEAMKAQQVAARDLAAKAPVAADIVETRDQAVATGTARLAVANGALSGTLPLTGRIDDLLLTRYVQTLGGQDHVPVLSPAKTAYGKYAEFGWLGGEGETLKLPGKDTVWTVSGNRDLAPGKPVVMTWSNGQGLAFERTYSIDDKYLITVTQKVTNTGGKDVRLHPYALIAENGLPEGFVKQGIVHQGPIGYVGDKLHQYKYKAMDEKGEESFAAMRGWIGITDKYWVATLIPPQGETYKYRFVSTPIEGKATRRYQVDVMGDVRTLAPGASIESAISLFAGAKEVRVLDAYEKSLNVPHFDLIVDFGLYYFLTKPFFFVLSFLGHVTGNFGIAIILMTILLRAAMFPLNNTSYRSFAKLKKIAPEMNAIRDKHGKDKQKLQQELMALYSREKVNPAAGCLPILLQIPIFFALYKVLSVTIEMRHAPFFGWIHDLSIYDPTSVFNLFGLLPYDVPSFLIIGAWPCMMMIGMLVQQRMNPPPQDPVQAQMIRFMPYFMTFIMAKFAAGLVIYWTVSNILSVTQQYIIMRSMGVKVSFIHRPKAEKELEEKVLHGPAVHPEAEMIEEKIEGAIFPGVTPPKPRRKKKR